jgi:hypothetical protein
MALQARRLHGTLQAINGRGVAIGDELNSLTNTTLPVVVYGIGRRVVHVNFDRLAPSVDVAFTGVSNGPVVSGVEFGSGGETIGLIGALPVKPDPLKLLDAQPTLHVTGLTGVDTNGLIAGSALEGGVLGAVLLIPHVLAKLSNLEYDIRDQGGHEQQLARLSAATTLLFRGRMHAACDVLTRLRHHFDLDHYYALADGEADDASDLYWSVREAQEELGCPNIGPPVVDPPVESQQTITTVIGSPQVMRASIPRGPR